MTGLRIRPLAVASLAALVVAAAITASRAAGALATTGPSTHYNALAKITPKRIDLFTFIGYRDSPYGDLVPTTAPIARGSDMSFTILNTTKSVQRFAVDGGEAVVVRPGKRGHLHVAFVERGIHRYTTEGGGRTLRGVIKVE